MKLTSEQMEEIKTNCLDAICEDMSFPANERMELTELAMIHIQGLTTCKYDTTLHCDNDEETNEAEKYLINLFASTL